MDDILCVQEEMTLLYSNLPHKIGHYFLDTQQMSGCDKSKFRQMFSGEHFVSQAELVYFVILETDRHTAHQLTDVNSHWRHVRLNIRDTYSNQHNTHGLIMILIR